MKTRMLILVIIFLIVVSAFFTAGSKKKLSTQETMETLSGTWVNKKYDTMGRMGKLVFERNGTFLQYTKINGIIPYVSGVFSVEDVRIDATGNIRCKIIIEIPGDHTKYKLSKITDSGTTLVFSMSSIDYPGKLGPNYFHYKYRIYYRQ